MWWLLILGAFVGALVGFVLSASSSHAEDVGTFGDGLAGALFGAVAGGIVGWVVGFALDSLKQAEWSAPIQRGQLLGGGQGTLRLTL
jgi:hypothetical protein